MTATLSLLDRLDAGPVVCPEGYLFEFERRGYLQAGAFVPEIVLERPDLVRPCMRSTCTPARTWCWPSPTTGTARSCG
jgi:hypothetical protein